MTSKRSRIPRLTLVAFAAPAALVFTLWLPFGWKVAGLYEEWFYIRPRRRQRRRGLELALGSAPRFAWPGRRKLADFYFLLNRRAEAMAILQEITKKAPHYLPAWRLLAEINFVEGRLDDRVKALAVRQPTRRCAKRRKEEPVHRFRFEHLRAVAMLW